MTDPIKLLQSRANQYNVRPIFDELLTKYPQFERWSGSHEPYFHHYGDGGLIQHTAEVIELGLTSIPTLNIASKVDPIEYFLAALFHDTGKMYDYDRIFPNEYKSSKHKRLIHHISRSGIIWHDCVVGFSDINTKYHDSVYHAILAHHGHREFGSPVAPKTHVAWMLHLCDGLSARMNDCDKMDVVDKDRKK